MHIAVGYRWFPTAAAYHMERALQGLGHTVTYVGLGEAGRPGFSGAVPIDQILAQLPHPPDLYLWIDPAGPYFPPAIEQLSIPTACYLIDVHLGHWRRAASRFFDAVFVAQRDYVETLQLAAGHSQVYWLPLAAATDVHFDHTLTRVYEVGFVGNIARAHQGTARASLLKLLAERFKTNDFYRHYTPQEVGEVYSQSQVVVNSSISGDVTMRIFEASACGALVLTDAIANGLEQLFVPGEEIVVYRGEADLLNKVRHYLDHPDERARVAQAGKARTLAEHTYAHRAQQIVDIVGAATFQRAAPMRTASTHERSAARRTVYTHLHMVDAHFDLDRALGAAAAARLWHALPAIIRRALI